VINDGVEGGHTLYVNGRGGEPFFHTLSDGQIRTVISYAREYLLRAHIKKVGWLGKSDQVAYDSQNRKPRDKFFEDLRRLASIGWELFAGVFPDVDKRGGVTEAVRQASKAQNGKAVIQVGQTFGSTLAFPWYLIYDIPFAPGAPGTRCPFLDQWDPVSAPLEQVPPRCPTEDAHNDNVVCPYGFWGFAHIIELPPFVDVDVPLCESIRTQSLDTPIGVTAGVSSQLNAQLTRQHFAALDALFERPLTAKDTSRDILDSLASDVELVYFYCHGDTDYTPEKKEIGPVLTFAKDDHIRPADISAYASGKTWPPDHWQRIKPLVFINGCHTTDLRPEILSNFVKAFVGSRAAGVIGTEVSIHQQVANEAAQELFQSIRSLDATVGRAVQQMRWKLLAKGNVMGLAYNAYCSERLVIQPTSLT
jgi:hypothetical protein